jgi:hypothetical protein
MLVSAQVIGKVFDENIDPGTTLRPQWVVVQLLVDDNDIIKHADETLSTFYTLINAFVQGNDYNLDKKKNKNIQHLWKECKKKKKCACCPFSAGLWLYNHNFSTEQLHIFNVEDF